MRGRVRGLGRKLLKGADIMTMCKYEFSDLGIKAMYRDSLGMVFSALCGENRDFTIEELDIHISIGDKEINIPIYADAFEMIFDCLHEINRDLMGEENYND